jgi:NADP-dependent aldehyde dehydrogenase
MSLISGTDPRTGQPLPFQVSPSTTADVAEVCEAAQVAGARFAGLPRDERAALLDAIAAGMAAERAELVATASAETGFGQVKLESELVRAAFQFRFFADVVRDGGFLEAAIDHAGSTPMGPRPDLRRMLVPIGPVAVFGSSNFPFAFSVLGGDTASALAGGNPVVLKAHDSHPHTSLLSHAILREQLGEHAPSAGIVFGHQAGVDLVANPRIRAVGFTGSLDGGRALLKAIDGRDEPIPFYGELSSLNPVFVTPDAAATRAQEIGEAYATSMTVGSGQLCTKPGLVAIPKGADGDALVAATADALARQEPHVLLNHGIHASYRAMTDRLESAPGVRTLVKGATDGSRGYAAGTRLFEVDLTELSDVHAHEIFGPASVVVRYEPAALPEAFSAVLDALPANLTVTLQVAAEDAAPLGPLTRIASGYAGRIVFNGFPTGVAVSWAQTHGGPWPSTNSLHTSVGATAIRRFLRPVTFQDCPAAYLPVELTDDATAIPRRIDGELTLPSPVSP